MESTYKYDVALSFAGEDREVASSFARLAQASDLKVFIDEEHLWEAWGKNLNEYLADVYYNQSRYCVIIISKDYCQKAYTNLERRIALDRVLTSKEEYVLPLRLDDSWPDGLPRATGFLDIREMPIEKAAVLLIQKIKNIPAGTLLPAVPVDNKLLPIDAVSTPIGKKSAFDQKDQPLGFVSIQLTPQCKGWRPARPRDSEHDPDLCWRTGVYDDPVFDITITNKQNHPLLVTAVGIEVTRLQFDKINIMGGDAVQTVALHRTYKLPLPDLWKELAVKLKDTQGEMHDPVEVIELVYCRLPDPVIIEPGRYYRYGLHLFNYVEFFPNSVDFRYWAKTDAGQARSAIAELCFEIGRTTPFISRFFRYRQGQEEQKRQQHNAMQYYYGDKEDRKKELAYRLWEKSGRPQGADKALWEQAEQILPAELLAEQDLRMLKRRPF
jgi:TIR domain/Protein of unknown function (DUF2934)